MVDLPAKLPLEGQVALITGATGGIGAATSRLLASLGCSVGLHFNSDEKTAETIREELSQQYKQVPEAQFLAVTADMGNYEDVRKLHDKIVAALGPPTILINDAGSTGGLSGVQSIDKVSIEDFEKTWRINCGSAYLLTQLCIPAMEQKDWGRVVFASSVAGITGGIVGPHYASSKSALHGMVHWLASVYAKKGITVNGIAPALIQDTKMLPGSTEEFSKKIPVGRLGTPDEIADTILWMIINRLCHE